MCRTVTVQGSASLGKEWHASKPPSWSSRQCGNTISLCCNACKVRLLLTVETIATCKKKPGYTVTRLGHVYRVHRASQKLRLLVSECSSCIRGTHKVLFSLAVTTIVNFTSVSFSDHYWLSTIPSHNRRSVNEMYWPLLYMYEACSSTLK